MKTEKKISGCYHMCPFFATDADGMKCGHPYWIGKRSFDNMIITQQNSRYGKIPEKCPLRDDELIITYTLDDDKGV